MRKYELPTYALNITICGLIVLSVTPLVGTISKVLITFVACVGLSSFRVRRSVTTLRVDVFIFCALLVVLSVASLPLFGPAVEHWKFVGAFILVLLSSILLLESVDFDRLLRVNFYFTGFVCLVTVPLFLFFQYNLLNPGILPSYEYGGYTSKTAIFLNLHVYLDASYSGRFVGFGSEPGLSQLCWIVALYYGVRQRLSLILSIALIGAILLGRSPIGFLFVLFCSAYFVQFKFVFWAAVGCFFTFLFYNIEFTILFDLVKNNKVFSDYLLERFERDLAALANLSMYLLPGGVYNTFSSHELDDVMGFGGVIQMFQRFGAVFVAVFFAISLARVTVLRKLAPLLFLSMIFFTQSVFLNALFFCLWFGVLYGKRDVSRFLYIRPAAAENSR